MIAEVARRTRSIARWFGGTDRRLWNSTFAVLTVFVSVWAIGAPYFSGPDEALHVSRAWSVGHGEVIGDNPHYGGFRVVHVPRWLTVELADPACFKLDPQVPADCHSISPDSSDATTNTNGAQLPTFYIPTGLPFLVATGGPGMLLARIVGGAITAAFLASALLTARRSVARRWLVPSLVVAVPPMVLYISAVTNPSGMEIAASVSLWLAAIVLATERSIERRMVIRLVVAIAGVMLARQIGPLWVAVVVAFALVLAGRARIAELARSNLVRLAAIVTVLLGIIWAGWTLFAHPFLVEENPNGSTLSGFGIVQTQIGRMWALAQEAIGVFGWLENRPLVLTHLIWLAAVSILVAICLMCARRRVAFLPALLLVAAIVIQTYAEYRSVPLLGFFWQGRYTLPMLVGVPLLAGYGIGSSNRAPFVATRAAAAAAVALGVALFLAYYQFLRRYTVGAAGSLQYWLDPVWRPPVPIPVLLAGALLATVAWLGLIASASTDAPVDSLDDATVAPVADGVLP